MTDADRLLACFQELGIEYETGNLPDEPLNADDDVTGSDHAAQFHRSAAAGVRAVGVDFLFDISGKYIGAVGRMSRRVWPAVAYSQTRFQFRFVPDLEI